MASRRVPASRASNGVVLLPDSAATDSGAERTVQHSFDVMLEPWQPAIAIDPISDMAQCIVVAVKASQAETTGAARTSGTAQSEISRRNRVMGEAGEPRALRPTKRAKV